MSVERGQAWRKSGSIARKRTFSARVQLMALLFEQIRFFNTFQYIPKNATLSAPALFRAN
ncbi:hypothetical protein AUK22_04105 [bacterium CG2_30_54_10]|nr:MAG: hypothetical protein AUK22_04105 [bacterium CG2_30_54_10]